MDAKALPLLDSWLFMGKTSGKLGMGRDLRQHSHDGFEEFPLQKSCLGLPSVLHHELTSVLVWLTYIAENLLVALADYSKWRPCLGS